MYLSFTLDLGQKRRTNAFSLRQMIFIRHWPKASDTMLAAGLELKCEQYWKHHLPINNQRPSTNKGSHDLFFTLFWKDTFNSSSREIKTSSGKHFRKTPCRISVMSITPIVSAATAPSIRSWRVQPLGLSCTAGPRVTGLWPLIASQRSYWSINKGKCTREPAFRRSLRNTGSTSLFYTVPQGTALKPTPKPTTTKGLTTAEVVASQKVSPG